MLREQAEHMDAPDRCSSLNKSSCAAGVVHTWTYNGRIIAQLRWCRGRPRHHVTTSKSSSLAKLLGATCTGEISWRKGEPAPPTLYRSREITMESTREDSSNDPSHWLAEA